MPRVRVRNVLYKCGCTEKDYLAATNTRPGEICPKHGERMKDLGEWRDEEALCIPTVFFPVSQQLLDANKQDNLRQRPEDQPLPLAVDGPNMQDLVIADLEARKQVGLQRYGQLLKADDGRDNLRDLYEELMDALVYLRKEIYRRDRR